jgi:hypothetical protein
MSRKNRFDIAAPAIAHEADESQSDGLPLRPGAKADTLDKAADPDSYDPLFDWHGTSDRKLLSLFTAIAKRANARERP